MKERNTHAGNVITRQLQKIILAPASDTQRKELAMQGM
jgi:hypothetical protein